MTQADCWRRFEEAARAALAGIGTVPRAYLAAVRRRCGDETAARQEKELRAYIAHLREKGK
ncbi:hypothetical protein PanNE5_03250 [Pandoraea sp. NE5]|nr:hypothetical protein PanNE5_03250 [Pandoraea sp. NE5]